MIGGVIAALVGAAVLGLLLATAIFWLTEWAMDSWYWNSYKRAFKRTLRERGYSPQGVDEAWEEHSGTRGS